MGTIDWPRTATLSGLGFTVLALVGTAITPSQPDFVDTPAKAAAYYGDEPDMILASGTLYMLSTVLFVWFLGSLYTWLRASEGGAGRVSAIVLGSGAAGSALMFAASSADIVGALRVRERDEIDPIAASLLWDLTSVLFGLAAPMALAALVLACALLSFRVGALPRWLGALSVLLGIAMLVPPINYLAIIVFVFWVGIVSVLLFMRSGAAAQAATTT